MIRAVFSLIFVFFVSGGFAQTCDSTRWAQPGTYAVSIDPSASETAYAQNGPIMLSGDDLCLIESSRKPTETTQIHIGTYLITIYPKKKFADNTIEE